MEEKWVAIEGYEEEYEVSNLGRVRSVDRVVLHRGYPSKRKGRILAVRRDGSGYHQVRLCKNGNDWYPKVHRLVATHFIPNDDPVNKVQINHIDEDKDNNRVDNLEWCTGLHNMRHSFAKEYVFMSPEGNKIEIKNLRKFCQENGLHDSLMSKVLKGDRQHHRGYRRWEN